ncbi:MAG: ABC transporter permease [Chloroflexi bacterium]|nr:ABC transporter permease [Chloroflexota bacterium]
MIFRNSLQSILRSKGKTALFTLLIFALTMALALSVSVWASVAQFLDDCDDFYTTIGLVEYMGTGYPDDTAYDPAMHQALASFDAAGVAADGAVLSYEQPARSFGYVDGFWRTDTLVPGRMFSVLVVGNMAYDERNNVYYGIVMRSLFSLQSKDDTLIYIDGNFGTFEPERYYLVFGEIYHGRSPLLHLRIASFENAIAQAAGIEVPRMLDITADATSGQFFVIPEDAVLAKVARTLPVTNNSVLVTATDDLMSLLPFHQQELYLVDGRAFTPEEYAQGSRVVVVSELLAKRVGVGIGDSIDLSVAVSDQPGIYNSYWVDNGFTYQESFTVVGIFNTVMDTSWYVYVPRSAGVPVTPFPVGFTVGQAVVQNDQAAEFYARLGSALGDRFQLTLYDQGYSTVAIPFQTILSVAKIVTIVCGLMELAVLILFGFLFVYRQRETSETMLMLGTGRARVCGYFLYSSALIALVATAAGAAAAYQLHDRIIALVARSAGNFALIDSRFSDGNLTISKTLEFAPQLGWQLFLYIGAAVFVLAVLACLAFTAGTFLHSRPSQKRPAGPNREHRTSRLGGGSLKYAVLSILRGGNRSAVVPILALCVVIFFGQLASTTQRYQDQLETIYANTTLQGYYTDINGRQIGNQVLSGYDVGNLYRAGQISGLSVSRGEAYYYLGITRFANGAETGIGPLYVPTNYFGREALEEAIQRGPDLTATNDIRTAPDFFYSSQIDMAFLEGYDESVLRVPSGDERVSTCILPTSLMAEKGIALGDTIRVAINAIYLSPEYAAWVFRHYDLRVVGSYVKQGAEDTIYAPLALFFDTGLIWDEGQAAEGAPSGSYGSGYALTPQAKDALQRTVFHSANFTLADSHALGEFKDYLSHYGYSQVKKVSSVRAFIVLKDAAFNNAIASTKQQIQYINILYPCLYVLVGIIAIVVSYLLVISRKAEFATLRGLGATRIHTFFSFFFEQGMLCLLGTAAGLAAWRLIEGQPDRLHLMLTAGFLGCYFLGCSISILIMNHTNVLTILLDRD